MQMARRNADNSPRRKRGAPDAETLGSLNLDFSQSPTTWKFLADDSFFRGLLGPVGSGKSYACAAEVMLRAAKQPASPKDNIRYSRFVVVRNSYPELRTTTLKTWTELFPESQWGAAALVAAHHASYQAAAARRLCQGLIARLFFWRSTSRRMSASCSRSS